MVSRDKSVPRPIKGRSAAEPVATHLAWRIPQQQDLKRALAEAQKGKVVDNAEVIAWLEGFIDRATTARSP